ncbi:MAG: tetratricopeptide repeat protein [Cyclobacteriaceae bacterium]|nr:tetratricopeptide repeat protein [Cyclobacteriaceae bacterium]
MRQLLILGAWLIITSTVAQQKRPASWYFEKGDQSLEKKEYRTAQAHFTECLRLDPYFAEAYRLRAIALEHLGEKSKALTDYNIYVGLKPENPEALFSRGVLRFDAGQWLPARQDFLKLLTLPPGETNTVYFSQEKNNQGSSQIFTASSNSRAHIFNYLGQIEYKIKRYDVSIAWLDSAINLMPDNAGFRINRGLSKQEKKDNAGAIADFEKALAQDPDNSLARHNLAALQKASGNTEASDKLLDEAIQRSPGLPYPLADRAFHKLEKNDLAGALADYNEVVRLEPENEENYINRGLVKEKMNDLPGALKDFSKAIDLNDKNEKAWLCHGNILSKQNKWKDAIDDYTVAITHAPDYGLAYLNRALSLSNLKRNKEACEDLNKASKLGQAIEPKIRRDICGVN